MKLLFLRPGKLGDMIVITPLFRAVKTAFPDSYIAIACSPYNEIVIRYNPFLDHIRVVNFHSFLHVIKLILWIRKQHFDWIIDCTPGESKTSTLISKLVRSKSSRTAGMHKGYVTGFFDRVTDNKDMHLIDRYKLLLEDVLNCRFSGSFHPDLFFADQHRARAEKLLECVADKSKIGINLSAGAPERQWTRENYHEYLKLLSEKYENHALVLFSVGKQLKWAEEFAQEFKNAICLPETDLLTITALIKCMSVFFTPDTSLMHIASGFTIPTVGIYCVGGENFIRWKSYKCMSRELVAVKSMDVNEITPLEAFRATVDLLEEIVSKSV